MNINQEYRVSVVIPAWNCGSTIKRAVDSVLAQTYRAHEIFVIDDGSTDDTKAVMQSYADVAGVILISQENQGVSVARNVGVESATGNWISFLDADDEWLPERLECYVEHAMKYPDLMWHMGNSYRAIGSKGLIKEDKTEKQVKSFLGVESVIENYIDGLMKGFGGNTNTTFIKREVFDDSGLFWLGRIKGQDRDMWLRISYLYPRVGYVARPLALYHIDSETSVTRRSVKRVDLEIDKMIDRHISMSEKYGVSERVRPYICLLLKGFFRRSFFAGSTFNVRSYLKKYRSYISFSYVVLINLFLVWPWGFSAGINSLSMIKKKYGFKKDLDHGLVRVENVSENS